MVQLRSTWSMTVSSSLPPVDVNLDRQTSIRVSFNAQYALVSAIAPSLSLDHVCGTASLPVGLRHIDLSIGQFRSALKTHLFN